MARSLRDHFGRAEATPRRRMTSETNPPGRVNGPVYGFSIRTHLLRLIAAVILPMLALAGVLAWYYGSAARQTIEAERLDGVT